MAGRPVYFVEVTDMSAAKARQVVLAARPQGNPRLIDFRLEETAIPAPGPGQVLLRVQYLSLDPYMCRRLATHDGRGLWVRRLRLLGMRRRMFQMQRAVLEVLIGLFTASQNRRFYERRGFEFLDDVHPMTSLTSRRG